MDEERDVVVDDLIHQLLEMGFEKQDCEEALAVGKYNISEALDWLLSGKPTPVSVPTLVLRKGIGSQSESTVDLNQSLSNEESLSLASHSNETPVSSRMAFAEESKLKYEEKLRKEAEASVKKARIEKKKYHEAVLQKIAEDRIRKKIILENQNKEILQSEEKNLKSNSTLHESSSTENKNLCFIQIRCPDGKILKATFLADETMNSLTTFIKKEVADYEDMILVQPFPKYEFTVDDLDKTFIELSLAPTSSLVLQLRKKEDSATPSVHSLMEQVESVQPIEEISPVESTNESNHELITSSNLLNDSQDSFEDQLNIGNEDLQHEIENIHHDIEHIHHDIEAFNHELLQMNPFVHPWGSGRRLGGQNVNDQQVVIDNSRLAAEHRLNNISPQIVHMEFSLVPTVHVTSLQGMCLSLIGKQILLPGYSNPLYLPAQVAEQIIHHMIKEMTLKPQHLQLFLSCHLTVLILDYFPFTTNELLWALRCHVSLQRLSLVSCLLINDKGLQALKSLRQLNYLNLRGCNQITDNCFLVLSEMTSLNTLILEGTKVTDNGLKEFLSTPRKNLMVLNLNKTNISSSCFQYFKNLSNLHILNLDSTKISSLQLLPVLKTLEGLSIQGTAVETSELSSLGRFSHLAHLNIADTFNIIGDEGLGLISTLKLISLRLPSRLTTTDDGLNNVTEMPLVSLDLTNYINIGDKGISFVGKILTLKRLHLSNTKMTDEGLLALKDLSKLEILYLDRTAITDAGTLVFKGMPKLLELSLACTRIKGRHLVNVLSSCSMLMKLNLSRTRVINKVLKGLTLPNLILLNCDGSRLSGDLSQLFTGCPFLKHVSSRNLQPYDPFRDESDSD